jgi:diguanylate cyclase (GGDEF)-like protein
VSDRHGQYSLLLDSLDIALCVFDAHDRAVTWNQTFLRFFPEHDGHVHVGEPYEANLRRFYACRLSPDELCHIDRYIAEGLIRHREQTRPFVFKHRGRQLRVASLPPGPTGQRIRIWREDGEAYPGPAPSPDVNLTIDDLDYIPDGATILDSAGRIIAANMEFRRLYKLPIDEAIVGLTPDSILAQLWSEEPTGALSSSPFDDNLKRPGVPFEVALPGDRWCRVIAHQTPDGTRYLTHSEITELKRRHQELQRAEALAREREQQLLEEHYRLAAIAATDGLTGLANRRQFDATLAQELRRSAREILPISLMLIDVDHFKEVNDKCGHLAGDACLQRVAEVIRSVLLRPGDFAARYGGEEFAVILPATDAKSARLIAERLRQNMAKQNWSAIHPEIADIRLSIGICSMSNARQITAEDLINEADTMLYRAKSQGRDRVEQSSRLNQDSLDRDNLGPGLTQP